MGILRTDKISGLETPTSVTGSVSFDGNDHLEIGAAGNFNFLHNALSDWTAEFWVKTGSATRQFAFGTGASSAQTGFSLTVMSTDDNQADGTGVYAQFSRGSSGNYRYWGSNSGLTINTWHHVAAVFKSSDKTLTLYVDGREVDSGTGTANGTFATTDYSTSDSSFPFVVAKNRHADTFLTGEISNLRVVSGRRLYTSNFTPPVHALETINGTRILCCNNPDSVTAVSNAGIGIAHTTATGGDPTVATDNPGLTRDFTFGTQFEGVTRFDTQGYFVPPSGTTEQQFLNFGSGGGDRGLFTGGHSPTNAIDYITISSTGDSKDFGDLTYANFYGAACASSIRGLHAGGATPGIVNTINYVTIMSTGNAFDFGDLTRTSRDFNALASKTRGVFAGGINPGNQDVIDFVTIASTSNAVDFGDLSAPRNGMSASSSPTRGIFAGGTEPSGVNTIEFITIASLGDAQEFGDLIGGNDGRRWTVTATASQTRSVIGGGAQNPGGGTEAINILNFITIASTGNAQDFGDLTLSRFQLAGVSNSTRGAFAGGYIPSPISANQDTIDYITIATLGNAQDFGNLAGARREMGSCSNGHGGLG